MYPRTTLKFIFGRRLWGVDSVLWSESGIKKSRYFELSCGDQRIVFMSR